MQSFKKFFLNFILKFVYKNNIKQSLFPYIKKYNNFYFHYRIQKEF